MLLPALVSVAPTAQALLAETAATLRRLAWVPGLGLGTCFQAVPFQPAVRVFTEKLEPLTA